MKWRFVEALEDYVGKGGTDRIIYAGRHVIHKNFISSRDNTEKFPSDTELSVPFLKSILKNWTGKTPDE